MKSSFVRNVAILNCAIPAILLGWDALHSHLGANPINFAIRTTGIMSIIFLVLCLAVTPVIRISGFRGLAQFRRTTGVSAFCYAFLHLCIYFGFDRDGIISETLQEILSRPFLLVGTIGLALILPLAVTSTDGMIRRLGGRRWKHLHRLAYAAAFAGALHFYMLVKSDTTRPSIVAAILGALFAWRLLAVVAQWRRDSIRLRNQVNLPSGLPKSWTGSLRLVAVFSETPNVMTFRFAPLNGGTLPFLSTPGQYLILTVMIDNQTVRRSYTIASPPSRNHSVEITVKREEAGLVSRYLHDQLAVGMVLTVTAPSGRFTFIGAEANAILMIAGGVGITPLMAKIRYLTDRGWPGRIHLVVSARTQAEIIFRHELEELALRHANLTVDFTLTRETNPEWAGRRGRIDESWITELVRLMPESRVHLCGPSEMIEPLITILKSVGVPSERIHQESFTSPSRSLLPSPPSGKSPLSIESSASLEFARSSQTVHDLRGRTILEIAEERGIAIPYDCRAAVCGQCKTRVLSGEVVMDADDALDTRDRQEGTVLACQARCLGAVVIDV
jgi:glycine betaine catabolism B